MQHWKPHFALESVCTFGGLHLCHNSGDADVLHAAGPAAGHRDLFQNPAKKVDYVLERITQKENDNRQVTCKLIYNILKSQRKKIKMGK